MPIDPKTPPILQLTVTLQSLLKAVLSKQFRLAGTSCRHSCATPLGETRRPQGTVVNLKRLHRSYGFASADP